MSSSDSSSEDKNTYILNAESATEMARLLLQDRLLNEAMKGLLPELQDDQIQSISALLDIGCGPGGWALDVANQYPHIHVTGIDKSEIMITYASKQATLHETPNVTFDLIDALAFPMKFPDQSFDLINVRAAVGYIKADRWPSFLTECSRMLRPGGLVRLTEVDSMGSTNSSAFEKHQRINTYTLKNLGYGFSPDGFTLGITPVLSKLLQEAGFLPSKPFAYAFNFSYGTPLYASHIQNITIAFKAFQPLLLRYAMLDPNEPDKQLDAEYIETLYNEVVESLEADAFRGVQYLLTVIGKKGW